MTGAQRDAIIGYFEAKKCRVCKRFFSGRERLFNEGSHAKCEYLGADEMTRRPMNFLLEAMIALYKTMQRSGKACHRFSIDNLRVPQ